MTREAVVGRLVDGIEDFNYQKHGSGGQRNLRRVCRERTSDELGTTRISVFRVVFRVTVEVFDAATREMSLRAMKGGGRRRVVVCLVTNT